MLLHHLGIALPAAAAIIWAIQKLRGPHETATEREAPASGPDQEDGEDVEVELPAPSKGGHPASFEEPLPLKAVLLDVTLPMPLAALWLALFHGSSALLSDFHQQLGDLAVSVSPWREKDDGMPRRVLKYTTPLNNRLGPRQACNTEVLEAAELAACGFWLRACATSEGVPFSTCFANHIQWVAVPHGTHSSRLVVSGECRFHSPVWGPLKGQIERESIKGMSKAYRTLLRMLEQRYGAVQSAAQAGSSSRGKPAGLAGAGLPSGKLAGRPVVVGADTTAAGQAGGADGAAPEGFNISALLQNPQTNAAAFLALMVVMLLVWRLAFMHQASMLQVARGVAAAVRR